MTGNWPTEEELDRAVMGTGVCLNPDCPVCYDTVLSEFTEADVVWYMSEITKRRIRAKERAAIMAKAKGLPEEERVVPHITEFEDLVDVLPDLAKEYRRWSAQEKEAKEKKAELAPQINALLDAVGQKSIRGDDWIAIYVEGGFTETLSKELLLKAGVSIDVITAAIEKKPKAGYIQVREREFNNG